MSDGQITNGQREGHDFPPLNAAWLMACAARDAAAAWTQPGPPEDVPDLADHLQHAFRSLSHALLSLTCCIDCTPPHEREPHSFEVSQHVYRASMVIDQAGAVLLRDLPLRPGPRTSSAAAEAGYELARRISSAYLSIGKPSSTTPAVRTATIEAFRHATGDLSAVAGTLAAQLPDPGARRFTTAQARLTEADEHLASALERSGIRPGQPGRRTLAQRARDRYALNRHPRPGPAITPPGSPFPAFPPPRPGSRPRTPPRARRPCPGCRSGSRGPHGARHDRHERAPSRRHARRCHPEQFTTAHAPPIPRALFPAGKAARVFQERQAVMADPAVPEWVPDFPPVRSARIIFAKAQDAARAWEQPVTPGELLTISKDLGSALGNTGAALSRLSVYHAPYQAPADKRFRLYDHPDEPNIFIECAARALDCAGSDMTLALSDYITRSGQPDSPALSAGARLAEATRTAYVIIERPSGSAAGRDVAVSAFMAAAGALDAAVENLAAHASAPMSAILARQRVRLEQAHIALRESLAASAAGKDVSGGPAAARSMRERHPILSHRSRSVTDAPGRAATTLATAAFPQPALGPAAAATRQPAPQASPARLRVQARRPGTYGALL